jgi:hypothetical protein
LDSLKNNNEEADEVKKADKKRKQCEASKRYRTVVKAKQQAIVEDIVNEENRNKNLSELKNNIENVLLELKTLCLQYKYIVPYDDVNEFLFDDQDTMEEAPINIFQELFSHNCEGAHPS